MSNSRTDTPLAVLNLSSFSDVSTSHFPADILVANVDMPQMQALYGEEGGGGGVYISFGSYVPSGDICIHGLSSVG
jgi:hypothetical protein